MPSFREVVKRLPPATWDGMLAKATRRVAHWRPMEDAKDAVYDVFAELLKRNPVLYLDLEKGLDEQILNFITESAYNRATDKWRRETNYGRRSFVDLEDAANVPGDDQIALADEHLAHVEIVKALREILTLEPGEEAVIAAFLAQHCEVEQYEPAAVELRAMNEGHVRAIRKGYKLTNHEVKSIVLVAEYCREGLKNCHVAMLGNLEPGQKLTLRHVVLIRAILKQLQMKGSRGELARRLEVTPKFIYRVFENMSRRAKRRGLSMHAIVSTFEPPSMRSKDCR